MGLLIYKIAPIKKKRYVFTSFNGHYSDNTKYISIKLHETLPDAEIIWLVLPEYAKNVPDYAKAVDINSLKSYWYRGTATAQIDNVYGFRANFKMTEGTDRKLKFMAFLQNKKKQPVIATMHGTPIKKLGRDQNGNTVFGMICPNTSMIVGDKLSAEVFRRITFETMPVDVIGWPRNDVLFAEDNGIREELGLPVDKKILLFAPTFRNDGKDTEGKNVHRSGLNQLAEMDFGDFEGKKQSDIAELPEYVQWIKGGADACPPNGENFADFQLRCISGLDVVFSDMMAKDVTRAAVVTHGGVITNLLSGYGLPKGRPADFMCGPGEGFEIILSTFLWQKGPTFEISGRIV